MTAFRLDLEWRTTLLTACLLPALVGLGFWQIERADEKAILAAVNAERAVAAPVTLGELQHAPPDTLAYRRVEVSGYFEPGALLFLDNQIRDGRYGHDVLSVFVDRASGMAAIVNRGWVRGDAARRGLPAVETPSTELTLTATVYVPPGEPYLLAEERFEQAQWPLLVQEANGHNLREAIEKTTGFALFPRELRLERGQPAGFRRDWPVINVSPDKHRGYALQWFTMAAALLLFFIFRSSNLMDLIRSNNPTQDEEH